MYTYTGGYLVVLAQSIVCEGIWPLPKTQVHDSQSEVVGEWGGKEVPGKREIQQPHTWRGCWNIRTVYEVRMDRDCMWREIIERGETVDEMNMRREPRYNLTSQLAGLWWNMAKAQRAHLYPANNGTYSMWRWEVQLYLRLLTYLVPLCWSRRGKYCHTCGSNWERKLDTVHWRMAAKTSGYHLAPVTWRGSTQDTCAICRLDLEARVKITPTHAHRFQLHCSGWYM